MKSHPLARYALAACACFAPARVASAQSPFPYILDLETLASGDGVTINGARGQGAESTDRGDYSARAVALAGDINNDGIDDLLIGAPYVDTETSTNAGCVYVLFGGAEFNAHDTIELADLDPTMGFCIFGATEYDECGISAAAAGDVNGDGVDDIIVGAVNADRAGNAYIIFGAEDIGAYGPIDLGTLSAGQGAIYRGFDVRSSTASTVSAAGDLNADGFDDVVIGARLANPGRLDLCGQAYVIFGAADLGAHGVVNLDSLNGANGFYVNGRFQSGHTGSAFAVGDVNNDGRDDLLISAPYATPRYNQWVGEVYVLFGSPTIGSAGVMHPDDLDGGNGVVIVGAFNSFETGRSLATGDLNADGVADIIMGAVGLTPDAEHGFPRDIGGAWVLYGGAHLGDDAIVDLEQITSSDGFLILGVDESDQVGASVAATDLNADGIDDLIIGAPGAVRIYKGETYVFFGAADIGADAELFISELESLNAFRAVGFDQLSYSGSRVAAAGDVNADGVQDFIIGASSASPDGRKNAGQSYLIFGRRAPQPGDLTNDGRVDLADMATLLGDWGACPQMTACPADFDESGAVAAHDLAILLSYWTAPDASN